MYSSDEAFMQPAAERDAVSKPAGPADLRISYAGDNHRTNSFIVQ